jgi:putative transposase
VDHISAGRSADGTVDAEVVKFRANFESLSPWNELIPEGARRSLHVANDAEVDGFLAAPFKFRDDQGRPLVVRNGSLPEREILTGTGRFPMRQPHVSDTSTGVGRVQFSPDALSPYLKRTGSIETLIP